MRTATAPPYLAPYLDAAQRHGAAFESLLWATQQTQTARFAAICRLQSPRGRSVLDVGCGRADFLDYCLSHDCPPADYIGIDAVPALVEAAQVRAAALRGQARATILAADVVLRPAAMFVGADLLVISGALNTLDDRAFQTTIRRAFDATAEALVFNFLEAPWLAAADYLTWHRRDEVMSLARTLSRDVRLLCDYLDGDATVAIRKVHE